MPRLAAVLLVVSSVLTGCAESQNAVKAARDARYNTTFNNVWLVVQEEVHRRYVNIHREDAVAGVIETDYRTVESNNADFSQAGPTAYSNIGQSSLSRPIPTNQLPGTGNTHAGENAIFRLTVQVLGPPWKVSVDGAAAKVSPGMALPVPYRRGAADEPAWVQARIDSISVAIYERLKKFVVAGGGKVKVEQKRADTSAWSNISDPTAVAVIEGVRKAAGQRNADGVRPFMSADFRWDEGADPSADTAVAVWNADATSMQMLARALDGGCEPDASKDILCPKTPTAETGRARFRQVAGVWKLVEFMK